MKAQEYKHFFRFLEKLPFEISLSELKPLKDLYDAGVRYNPNAKTKEEFITPAQHTLNGKVVLYNLYILEGELKELKEIWKT